ncbi:hydroxymethylglutaryl-CoA reductase, degradative [Streptomyces celluloflavus]|uniref:hydroxymethylglutaryl-CoA reductase, degradative n=1 Tax=Streptomyces celluloflavus TaxID=58344 RepID=UPI00368244D1
MTSRLPGFYRLPLQERLDLLSGAADLTASEREHLESGTPLQPSQADNMIENAIGIFALPYAVAVNFQVNGRDYLIPMVTEEPSVVAAASNAARVTRECGGIEAEADPSLMIGQIHVTAVTDPETARERIRGAASQLVAMARSQQPRMVARGCGAREIDAEVLPDRSLLVHLVVDVGDAMGANTINTLVEAIAPEIVAVAGGVANVRIVSNLADRRMARARTAIGEASLKAPDRTGADIAQRIAQASQLATVSPHRAATHNKGVMNGIDAMAIATGQDWRAIEAGAHAFASRTGSYQPLATWRHENAVLRGLIEIPLAVGTVGDRIRLNPRAGLSLRLLGVSSARELAMVMAAVGLAQNFAALRALVGEGIQRGHMALHRRSEERARLTSAVPGRRGPDP